MSRNKSALLAVVAALAQFSLGYGASTINFVPIYQTGALAGLTRLDEANLSRKIYYSFVGGVIGGALLTIFAGTYLGRKKSTFIGAGFAIIGAIVMTATFSFEQFFAGRALTGLGYGFIATTTPVWQVEVHRTRSRGKLVVAALVFEALGVAFSAWGAYGYALSSASGYLLLDLWRLPVGLQLVPLALLVLLLFLVPESARWLVSRGKREDALYAISRSRGLPLNSPEVVHEINRMQAACEHQHRTPMYHIRNASGRHNTPSQPYKNQKVRAGWRMLLGVLLQFLLQFCGGQTLGLYFAQFPLTNLNISYSTEAILSSVLPTWRFLAALLAIFLVDALGRRGTLLMGFAGQLTICAVITGLLATTSSGGRGYNYSYYDEPSPAQNIAVYVFHYLFQGLSAILDVTAFLYVAEINAWKLRIVGSAVATAAIYVASIAVTEFSSYLVFYLDGLSATPFIGINFLVLLLAYLFLPETGGRTLEWLEYFNGQKPRIVAARDSRASKRRWGPGDEWEMDQQQQQQYGNQEAMRYDSGAHDIEYSGARDVEYSESNKYSR